ncbi:DUF2634 domain-containing protein [Leptospira bouyouniensis]|uniref:DUF2634 domain-containing protein n=1 Tax=Leptospira bouyouniensis TaxID=2484911 RepID=A0A7I0HSN4_9LEPT|nr:DUF2634 domain-containing protein [Leptospira bouyouniensis]TGL06505.1 DUF2634 domain-containing protein [Leptospira bouyouniensis]
MRGLLIRNNDTVRENGRLVVIDGIDYYKQRILIAIKTNFQENVYARNVGINWVQIFSEKVSQDRILSELRKVILKDSETVAVTSLEIVEFNRDNRKLSVKFKLISIYGNLTLIEDL